MKLLLCSILLLAACHDRQPEEVTLDYQHPGPGALGIPDPQEQIDAIIKRVQTGDMPKVQFNFDSDKILSDSYRTLDAIAAVILGNPRLKVVVIAHTCTIGTEAYNLDLSRRRARSVKEYLVKAGIPPPSIRYYGMGFSMPIADNSTEAGREKNRRVEFRVTTRDWPSVY